MWQVGANISPRKQMSGVKSGPLLWDGHGLVSCQKAPPGPLHSLGTHLALGGTQVPALFYTCEVTHYHMF